jgi:hypothetical protein
VTIKVQEVDDVPQHGGTLDATFMSPMCDKVTTESTWLLHLLKLRVDDTRAISMGEGSRAARPRAVVVLPLVEIVTIGVS